MSFLSKIFNNKDKEEAWKKLSEQIGGDFTKGSFFKTDKVTAKVNDWIITLDTYTQSSNNSSVTYTRLRAPYINADGFRFKIYNKSIFSGIGKFLGMQDIEVGYTEFDRDYIIKSNMEYKVRMLFSNEKIRKLITEIRNIYLEVKDDEGYFGSKFPEGVDELYCQVIGVIKDIEKLKKFFDLFAEILTYLCHIGSAYEQDPNVDLK